MHTGEGVGVLLRPKTLVEGQREGVGPRHGIRERLRGWRWRCIFYSAGLGVSLAERRSWRPALVFSLALAGAVGGGCAEREAEFLLAAAAARVNRWLAGGFTAGEEAFDDAGGEGEPSAGAAG